MPRIDWGEIAELGVGLLLTPFSWHLTLWQDAQAWETGNLTFELGPVVLLIQLPARVVAGEDS